MDERAEQYRLAIALMQEAICKDEVSVWPYEGEGRQALLCHRQYAQFMGHANALGCPLVDVEGKLRGALLVSDEKHLRPHVVPFLKTARQPLGTAFHLIHRAEQNRIWRKMSQLLLSEHRGLRRSILLAAVLLAICLCVPIRYTVKTPCRLEPSQRRYMAAPFDGKLQRCNVEPGDQVQQNQLLAILDGQEIEWELASVQAELQRAKKERVGYVAGHESGKARLSQHEIEYLQSKAQLLSNRIAQLEIRSPIDGIIVSGDLTKAEGMPLEVGQTLFEIAPLDSMLAEIAVPQDDIRFVEKGQLVKIRLEALPFEPYETQLDSVRPRSESRDASNVFIGSADIQNPENVLRPGMEGTARIRTTYHPLGWILFHKPIAAVLGWLGL